MYVKRFVVSVSVLVVLGLAGCTMTMNTIPSDGERDYITQEEFQKIIGNHGAAILELQEAHNGLVERLKGVTKQVSRPTVSPSKKIRPADKPRKKK